MPDVNVTFSGMDEIRKRAKKLPARYQKAVMDAILETAFVDVETGAKTKLTRDKHVDTGRLRASIHVKRHDTTNYNYSDNEGNSYDGTLQEKADKNEVLVGTNVEYAVIYSPSSIAI